METPPPPWRETSWPAYVLHPFRHEPRLTAELLEEGIRQTCILPKERLTILVKEILWGPIKLQRLQERFPAIFQQVKEHLVAIVKYFHPDSAPTFALLDPAEKSPGDRWAALWAVAEQFVAKYPTPQEVLASWRVEVQEEVWVSAGKKGKREVWADEEGNPVSPQLKITF